MKWNIFSLFKKHKNKQTLSESSILEHVSTNDTAIYEMTHRRFIPFMYLTLMNEAKCSCTIFVKHVDNMLLPGKDIENLLRTLQQKSVFTEIIILEQNEKFLRMILKLNSQSPTKIQLYVGEVNGVGSFQNFIIIDSQRYMLEKAYPIDYDYNGNIYANYSMNNPLACKWLLYKFNEYKKRITGTMR